jgi:amino-acid N-acetyltransferase
MSHSHQVLSATEQDIPAIQKLLLHYAGMGELLPRSRQDIVNNLTHFRVIKENQSIIACGSLEHFTDELAEVRSLMVDQNQKGAGLGRIIVQDIIETSKLRNIGRLMALTYVPDFFHKLGFRTVNKEIFPEKVWGICVNCYKFDNCDEIAVLLEL